MTSLKGSSQFCVFCYKTLDFPGETVRTSCDTKKFVKLLSRFVNCQNIEKDTLSTICCHDDKFLKCCNSCNKIIKSFCELYHNLKLLELQLDLNLNKLVDKIDYANKVPTRWISLNKILEDFFQNNFKRQAKLQSSIRSFRRNVVKAGNQRKLQSHPRVLLTKNEESFRQINERSTTEKLDITDHLVNEVIDQSENDVPVSEDNSIGNSDQVLSKPESVDQLLSKHHGNGFIDTTRLRRECKDMKCPICKHQLTSFRSLYVHLEYVHKYANLLKLQCGECGKRFCSKYYLTRHLKQHSREKPFVCRFCGLMYQAKHGLKLHLEEHHMEELDEEGIEQELNTKVCSKTANYQPKEFEGNGNDNVRRHYVPKHKDKYTVKKNGLTNVLYTREDVADNKPVIQDELMNKNAGGSRIQSTIFKGKDTISVHMEDADDDEIGTEYVLEGEEVNYGTDEHSNDTGESTPEATFVDPQIQIKLEHPSVSFNNSCENASTIIKKRPMSKEVNQEKLRITFRKTNISNKKLSNEKKCTICGKKVKSSGALVMHMKYHQRRNDNLNGKQSENKRKKNDFSPITKFTTEKPVMIQDGHDDDAEIQLERDDRHNEKTKDASANRQQKRYSLREKRICKFRSLGEMDSDNDDSDDNELAGKNKPKKAAVKSVETQIGWRPINNLRRNRNRIISDTGPKALIVECDICSRKFTSFLKKEHHFKVCHDPKGNKNTGKIFQCKYDGCTAYFLKRVQLKFHYKLEHRKLSDLRIGTTYDKNRFACPTCERRFPFKSNLKIHMEYHKNPSEWKWECGTCGKKSASEYKLKEHMTKHTNERPYNCRFCEEKFRVVEQLKEHYIKSHGDEEDIRTEIESKVKCTNVLNGSSLAKNAHSIDTPKLTGSLEKFTNKYVQRKRSMQICSSNGDDKSKSITQRKTLISECEICSRKLTSVLKKDHHFKKHHDLSNTSKNGITRCKQVGCSAYFLTNIQLKAHYKLEHNIKNKIELEGKFKVGKKHFECPLCGNGFPARSLLKTHLEYHKDSSEWKWECEVCGKKSATKYKLNAHIRTHANDHQHDCRFCAKIFRWYYELKHHLRNDHAHEENIQAETKGKVKRPKCTNNFSHLVEKHKNNDDIESTDCVIENSKTELSLSKSDDLKEIIVVRENSFLEIKEECSAAVRFNERVGIGESDEDENEERIGNKSMDENAEENKDRGADKEIAEENYEEIEDASKNDDTHSTLDNKMNGIIAEQKNILKRKGDCFGDGNLVEFEDLD